MNRFHRNRATTLGIGLALGAALISGVSVFINGKAVRHFDDASVFTTAKNSLVGLAFVALLLQRGAAPSRRAITRGDWARLGAISAVGGSIPFILFFEGLSLATPANAALIQKSLFLWVGFLAVPFLGERLGWAQVAALATLVVAQLLVGRPAAIDIGRGEFMVLIATLLWSVEVVIARKALGAVPVRVVATARLGAGAAILLGYLGVTGRLPALARFDGDQWRWLLGTAALLAVYVSVWFEALKRAPATVVTCVLTLAAPITVALGLWDGRPSPTAEQAAGYMLVLLAALVIAAPAIVSDRRAQTLAGTAAGGAL
jgi:drug/metabolite transporter (DMT)-like permease